MPVGIDEREPGRDKAHVVPDPRLLQKTCLVGAVAEGTGQVLYQDAIDFPAIDVFQQLPEAGALVLARPADAVVNIDFTELQVLMAGNVIEQPPALVGDACSSRRSRLRGKASGRFPSAIPPPFPNPFFPHIAGT